MSSIYSQIIKSRIPIIVLFLVAAAISLILKPHVGVNYDMKDYLPEGSLSTVSMDVMQEEFDGGIPNARIMIEDVTINQALEYKKQIEAVRGVQDVQWLDDSVLSITMPLKVMDKATVSNYLRYEEGKNSGDALMSVTIDEEKVLTAVPEIRQIIGANNSMTGNAVQTEVATKSTVSEIRKVSVFAIIMVLLILIITTRSWIEPLIILISIGIAIIINAGTNIIFGEISFVTNAAGSVLQLAVSMDYSIFLLHRYEECKSGHQRRNSIKCSSEAMVEALCKSTGSIASSGLTTVAGFMALVLMQYRIGPDLGLALGKGICISLITVFTFTPALILMSDGLLEKTRHRRLLPDFRNFGKFIMKATIPAICVFVLLIVPSFIASNNNSFYYGAERIFNEETKVGADQEKIKDAFGNRDTYALMVPKGDFRTEEKVIAELKKLPQVTEIKSYGETLSSIIPPEAAPDFIKSQLVSDNYSRVAISVNAESEGEKTFALVHKIRKLAAKYYGEDFLLAGQGVITYDLKTTTTADMLKVNILAIAAVFLVLILLLRSFVVPVILVAGIETAIWINLAVPFAMGEPVFYIAYLIISSIQLGATVDYAILMTNKYKEMRRIHDKKDAAVNAIASATPSIITSGLALVIVGFLLGIMSSHQLLAQLGIFIGRGAICSMLIVFFVLPGMLCLLDRFCVKPVSASSKHFFVKIVH